METPEAKNLENNLYSYSNEFQLATQLKSWMAINPAFGCIWDCAYCIQHKDQFYDSSDYKKVQKIKTCNGNSITPSDVVSEIMSNERITSKTPLAFYNFSDPFLPQNTKDLVTILEELDSRDFTNVVGLITRTYTDRDTLDRIANLRNLKPIVLVTHTGYENRQLESAPNKMRIKLMKELKSRGVPVIQYLRPLVREWIEEGQIERARDEASPYIDGVIMSGLRLTPEIIRKINRLGLTVPYVPGYTNKYFPKEIQEEVIAAYKGIAPVYRYTSCGVSATLGMPDFNAHLNFFRFTQGTSYSQCPLPCKKGQTEICNCFKSAEPAYVRDLLERIGQKDAEFTLSKEGYITVSKPLSKQDRTFLRHNTSYHVECDGSMEHHVDQVANMEVKNGTLAS